MNAVIIRNPISGSPQRQFTFARAVQAFENAGWQVEVWVTQRQGHERPLAARAVRDGWLTIGGGRRRLHRSEGGWDASC
ncbi:MAG TPA: hypothetical protein EYP25_00035 [Anaerolineae bacterium]|nr:hypothetical protein [Caldilineae bacterium]HID32958.1 hypothetical protein [Anaerolineae bacterium]HIQ12731.1 hypothetical protein [Caldilineales bacterium]